MRVGFFDYTPLIYAVTDNSFLLYYIYIYIYMLENYIAVSINLCIIGKIKRKTFYLLFIYLFIQRLVS